MSMENKWVGFGFMGKANNRRCTTLEESEFKWAGLSIERGLLDPSPVGTVQRRERSKAGLSAVQKLFKTKGISAPMKRCMEKARFPPPVITPIGIDSPTDLLKWRRDLAIIILRQISRGLNQLYGLAFTRTSSMINHMG
ncbi:hypothetical protein K438DRAFT_1773410 [Mycena galopus ATCC 62051]|nr:hypothetical protein K438DRAFT_1773410 [Mycena galopus ATCC 62051]